MIFDTHSHCYWDTLLPRIDEIITNMHSNNITKATQIGCDIQTSEQAIALARAYPGIFYATVGLHPETAQDTDIQDSTLKIQDLEKLILENREYIVAI
jgi:TatD DNase family protein